MIIHTSQHAIFSGNNQWFLLKRIKIKAKYVIYCTKHLLMCNFNLPLQPKIKKHHLMKKFLLIGAATLMVSNATYAGDYLTNTNQNAAFLRMLARGASIDVDGVYSNPAGLSFLEKDGFYLSLTGQSAFQTRNIEATTPLWTLDGKNTTKYFEGKASAPIIPSFQGLYKKGDWTISTHFGITGGGGKASFDQGLPLFNSLITGLITTAPYYKGKIHPSMYNINSAMDGKQYIFGLQLGLSYKLTDWVSIYAGGRMNYFTGGYEGFLNATLHEEHWQAFPNSYPGYDGTLAKIKLKCDQSGWGIAPILGVDFKFNKLNIGMKYEFMTNLNIENKTGEMEVLPSIIEGKLSDYKEGVNTPSDIPAMFSAAVGYEFLPNLRATVEYHYFDDKNAGMANDRQKALTHGTHEILVGAEFDLNDKLTFSAGFQNTDYGLSNDFQTDTSFSCDSYSVGLGARIDLTKGWSMDIAYFWTDYKDYKKVSKKYNGMESPKGPIPGTDIYSRSNKVFGMTLNYHF